MRHQELHIGHGFSLPIELMTQAIAVLAMRRAGKSYFARRLAEQIHKADQQIVIVDPKGDHWGIRSSADGKSPGIPMPIIGGSHGNIPLEPSAGEVIGKLVVEERVSLLLDLSDLRKEDLATFMSVFLETVYRLKARDEYRTPMMLMIDEADAIAPQKLRITATESRMLEAAEDIVRRGGQRGIGCAMVCQRSAVLHKNVLEQAQVLIALRTIGPRDRSAIEGWIDIHGTEEQKAMLIETLPSLPTGDAWVWSPGWPTEKGIFERIHTLPIETYDSGASPIPGVVRAPPKKLAEVDIQALARRMAATIERHKENDPAALRSEIARLKVEFGNRQAAPAISEEQRSLLTQVVQDLTDLGGRVEVIKAQAVEVLRNHGEIGLSAPARQPAGAAPPEPPRKQAKAKGTKEGVAAKAMKLDRCCRSILSVLHTAPRTLSFVELGLCAGYSPSGGGFRNAVSRLVTMGLAQKLWGAFQITPAARDLACALAPPMKLQDRITYWHGKVHRAEREILKALAIRPSGTTRLELAKLTDYEVDGGGFRNALSKLTTANLIEKNGDVYRIAAVLLADPS